MAIIYTYRWTAQFPLDPVREEAILIWFDALKDLSVYDIKRGIDVCASSSSGYVPSLGEFKDRCLPSMEELGLPEIDEAWDMAINQKWDCALVWNTVVSIGVYEFRNRGQKENQQKFAETYSKFVQRARKGEQFIVASNPQLPSLDQREFKKATNETRNMNMEKIREILKHAKQLQGKI